MSYDRLTFNSYKKDKPDNLKPPSSSLRQPPNPSIVRLCRLAFPVFFLANFAISAYIFTRAKQRDETKRIPSKLQSPSP